MICAKCDQPIKPGEPHSVDEIHAASGPGCTIRRHLECPNARRRRSH